MGSGSRALWFKEMSTRHGPEQGAWSVVPPSDPDSRNEWALSSALHRCAVNGDGGVAGSAGHHWGSQGPHLSKRRPRYQSSSQGEP